MLTMLSQSISVLFPLMFPSVSRGIAGGFWVVFFIYLYVGLGHAFSGNEFYTLAYAYIYCIAVYYRLQHHVAVLLKEMSVLSYSTGDSSVFIRPKRNKSIIVLIKSDGSI